MAQHRRRRRPRPEKNRQKEINQSFFPPIQSKLAIGKADDKYEKEADQIADKVVNNSTESNAVQKKGEEEEQVQKKPLANTIMAIQKLETPDVQEPLQKQEDEEAVQPKEEEEETVQTMEEEETVQKQEEEETVQAQEDEEEAVQAMEEEDTVQKQEEEETVQAKSKKSKTSPSVEALLKKSKGKGQNLSGDILKEMNKSFGKDFSNVKIHTNDEAVKMCEELGAQAFTNGNDIYFNAGKYSPDTAAGKHLLAHELTHTVQQSK